MRNVSQSSQAAQVKTAIDVDDFSSAEWKISSCKRRDCFADILRCAPTGDGGKTFRNELVIFRFNPSGHIGCDNSRPNFVNIDAKLGEACGVKRRQHREGSLGEAVGAAIDRGRISADR